MCFDRAADVYDTTRRAARPEAIEALAEELSDCASVLELGVGTGRLAVPLMERGFQVVGVDLSRKMLDVGRAKGLERLVMGNVCRCPCDRRASTPCWRCTCCISSRAFATSLAEAAPPPGRSW